MTPEESLVDRFRGAFFGAVQTYELAPQLKKAAATANLAAWTRALTDAVVDACGAEASVARITELAEVVALIEIELDTEFATTEPCQSAADDVDGPQQQL